MLKNIFYFFKISIKSSSQNEGKEQNKEEEYMPTQIEMWRFYLKFIKLRYDKLILTNFNYLFSSYASTKTLFIMIDFKNSIINNDEEQMKYLIIEFIAYNLIIQLLELLENVVNFDNYRENQQCVQKSILQHLFRLDIQYFEDNKVTQISNIIKEGTNEISSEIQYGEISQQLHQYIQTFGKLYFVYCQSPLLLIIMMVISLILNFVVFCVSLRKEKQEKELDEQNQLKDFVVDDILNNIQVIKTFGTEQKEIDAINKIIEKNSVSKKQVQYYQQIETFFNRSSYEVIKVSIILQIAFQLGLSETSNSIAQSITEIFNTIFIAIRFSNTIIRFIYQKPEAYYETGKKHIGKVMQLFKVKPEICQDIFDNSEDDYNSKFEGEITFNNVSFNYPKSKDVLAKMNQQNMNEEKKENIEEAKQENPTKELNLKQANTSKNSINSDSIDEDDDDDFPSLNENLNEKDQLILSKAKSTNKDRENVLENISFSIKKGQFVAFVGTSGSGKSTIVKLIQRYYDVNSGSILYDSQNIKDVSLNKVRRSIGLVSQEPTLFDNDIEYNITYGCVNDEYTQEELRNICDMSGVSEFVFDEKRFPQGLKTLVGSKGMKLSGGQKQRIAIARALIKKPKILILDEATSALDSESEHIVQQYIDQLVSHKGLTIVVVAHRLSTIVNSDHIFVMKHGQIREQGTHNQLLSNGGICSKLIHHQISFTQKLA